MFEQFPKEAHGGAVVGLMWLGLAVLRKLGLRASKDMITLKADAADRDAFDRLQKRVEQMDARIQSLESSRNKLFGFITRCMSYVSRCDCDNDHSKVEKQILETEYLELLKDAAK